MKFVLWSKTKKENIEMFPPLLLKPPDADMQWQETKNGQQKVSIL